MLIILLKFCLGLTLLLFSTQKIVQLAQRFSRIFKISPLIIGITIVAIGTSLPELTVSIISVLQGDPGLAVGNIIGSNIVNILLVLPIGLFIGKLRIGKTKTQQNIFVLILATLLFCFVQFYPVLGAYAGIILVGSALGVTILEYLMAIYGRVHEDKMRFKNQKKERLSLSSLLFVILLVSGIIVGGIFVVDSVQALSHVSGISTTILGFTLTAIATSLPELFTTFFSQGDNQEKITVGNIIGSNVYNLLLVGGFIALIQHPIHIQIKEWLWLGGSTAGFVAVLMYYKGRKPPRYIGLVLLLFFILYMLSQ